MPEHTITLQEKEFRLFQTIQHIKTNKKEKDRLIESLIQQIEVFMNSESLSAGDIIKLPLSKRQQVLTEQFQEAEQLYKENPDILIPDVDPPREY